MEAMQVKRSCCPILFPTTMLTFLLMLLSPLAIACPPHERIYLLDFTGGLVDYSNRLSSWNGLNCCLWDGVACTSHPLHVTALHLSNYNLSGDVHSSLFKLAYLERLDLSRNPFSAIPIPSDVGKLKRLAFLDLSDAGFAGEIPVTLASLSNLNFLDLSWNYYSDLQLQSARLTSWLKNLTRLEYLSLSDVNISSATGMEEWAEVMGTLSNLRQLSMSSCGLRGPIPNSLMNLTSLVSLDLSYNSLSAQIPVWFKNITSHLLSLDLSDNELFGPVPSNLLHSAHRLQKLDIGGNDNLRGDISFIAQQRSSSLQSIDLSGTSIGGEILSVVANTSSLKHLFLSSANIEGVIPPSIGNLSKLEELVLSGNRLACTIPSTVDNLSKLEKLDLSGNRLEGTIPSTVFELVSLKGLLLSYNNLSGAISLSDFDNLTRLEGLGLSYNHLTVDISSTWNPPFKHLLSLSLASCNLHAFPTFLVNQYYLQDLDLSANSIASDIPMWIWDLPYLENMNLSCNQLTGLLPSKLTPKYMLLLDLHNNSLHGRLPLPPTSIEVLVLSHNHFNDSIPYDIATYFGQAVYVFLSANNLTGVIPDGMCTIYMEVLDLSKNMLSSHIPPNFLEKCTDLSVLNLAKNHLKGDMPKLKNLAYLKTLNLNDNHLKMGSFSAITNCSSVEVLDLGKNNLEGTIPEWIENLLQLKILILKSNKFQGIIPVKMFGLPNLQILDLSYNMLSGTIPNSLSNLYAMVNASQNSIMQLGSTRYNGSDSNYHMTVFMKGWDLSYEVVLSILRVMDLSNNNLSGNIPPQMGSLQGLIGLSLARNHLTGRIPKTLGNMSQLESLDLSMNILEGSIPMELEKLNYLEFLNLSYNMLDGRVPHRGQFLTFDESSYSGNSNIFGFPFNTTHEDSQDEGGKSNGRDLEIDTIWWGVTMGLSYGAGFFSVVGLLYLNKRVRKIVFNFYDCIIDAMFQGR